MEKDIPDFFKELGFSENETKVYLALLDLGQTTIGPISAKSHVQPTKAYIALDKLIDRGLLSFVHIANAKHFQTSNPENVMRIVREKEERAKAILPLLLQKHKAMDHQRQADIYDGKEAVQSLYSNVINTIGPEDFYYAFALKNEYPLSESAQLFFRQKHQLMLEKGLMDDRVIVHESVKEAFLKIFSDMPRVKLCFVKADFPLGLSITKDRVVNTLWQGKPMSIEIRSAELAEQYKKFFLQVWDEHCDEQYRTKPHENSNVQ